MRIGSAFGLLCRRRIFEKGGRRMFGKTNRPTASAVIAAAGLSSRMGSNKLHADLGGAPVLCRTLEAFERCHAIDEIILCAREDEIPILLSSVKAWHITKLKTIVAGGKTRQESVLRGVEAVSAEMDLLCIHDGARPFVTPSLIERVLDAAARYGAATAAVRVKNTIKQADDSGFIAATPDRSTLWEAQTPQCFRAALYREAVKTAPPDCTDDCRIIEAAGGKVRLVEGDGRNIKLTTPEDLLTAQIFWETGE
jgi:2-C-methyl-D-erythritol 4-phosphate cytidylyltransferase